MDLPGGKIILYACRGSAFAVVAPDLRFTSCKIPLQIHAHAKDF